MNDTTSRTFGAWLIPGVMALISLVLPWLPSIDPKRANYEKFRGSYDLVINAAITAMAALHVATIGFALGWPVSMERLTPLMVGGLFLLLGNVMPRARPNWIFGIRTPWTLTNDRVWERTHRIGGFLFVGAGIVLMSASLLPTRFGMPLITGTVVVAGLVPLVYSYFAWKQETSRP